MKNKLKKETKKTKEINFKKIREIKGMMLSIRLQKALNGDNISPSINNTLRKTVARLYTNSITVQEADVQISKLQEINTKWSNKQNQRTEAENPSEETQEDNTFASEDLVGEKVQKKTKDTAKRDESQDTKVKKKATKVKKEDK